MLTSYECLKVLKFKRNIKIVDIREVYWIRGSGVGTLISIIHNLPKAIPLSLKCWESVFSTLWSKWVGKSIFTAQYRYKNNLLRQSFEESCLFICPLQHKCKEQCECCFSLLLVKGMRTFLPARQFGFMTQRFSKCCSQSRPGPKTVDRSMTGIEIESEQHLEVFIAL